MAAFTLDIGDYTQAWRMLASCLQLDNQPTDFATIDDLYRIAQNHAAPLHSLAECAAATGCITPDIIRRIASIAAEARETFRDIDERSAHFTTIAISADWKDIFNTAAAPPSARPMDADEQMLLIDNALLRFFGPLSLVKPERHQVALALEALEASLDEDTPAVVASLAPLIRSLYGHVSPAGAISLQKRAHRAVKAAQLLKADDVNLAFTPVERPDESLLAAPHWWPNWARETCIIVAGGYSAAGFDPSPLLGRVRFIAVNNAVRLVPQADILFSSDAAWWRAHRYARTFPGLRVSTDPDACREDDGIHRIYLARERGAFPTDRRNCIGWLGNSGSHALNLAVQFGCRKIILIGFDMSVEHGVHWHEPHQPGLCNPTARDTDLWRHMTDSAAPLLSAAGIAVINTSATSRLRRYPKMPLAEALANFSVASSNCDEEHAIGQDQ